MSIDKRVPKGGVCYRLFKHYVRFLHSKVFYRHTYYIDQQNVPEQGVPVLFASNHQNCANDPLALLLGLENESHPYVVARGDVFGKSKLADRFFNWIGMVPAFRLNFDGAEALKKNDEMLRVTGRHRLEGNRLIIFPEGGHQNKRYLGDFSFGYTRLAFEAAESDDFQTDIVIVPCCNHYSDYFDVKADFMERFGTPIHLKPYYELYKTKPRTAQREVNKLVRVQISSLMLNITDLDNYDAIDWIRNSEYGNQFARSRNLNPSYLPDKLESDKALFAALEEAKQTDPAAVQKVYEDTKKLSTELAELRIDDKALQRHNGLGKIVCKLLLQLMFLPVWFVSLYPNVILYAFPLLLLKTDKMFTNTLRVILGVVLGYPFFMLLTLLVSGLVFGWWWPALVWILLYPLFVDIAWYGWIWLKSSVQDIRCIVSRKKVLLLKEERQHLFSRLNDLIQKK